MRNKKTGAEIPEYRHPMPPPRPLPELDELSRESDSAPIYRKAIAGIATLKCLIDANAIKYHKTTECHGHGLFFTEQIAYKEEIEQIPAVDAVEVVHGWWIDGKCSNCNTVFDVEVCGEVFELREIHSNYCPNCGAKMDLKEGSE